MDSTIMKRNEKTIRLQSFLKNLAALRDRRKEEVGQRSDVKCSGTMSAFFCLISLK